MSQKDIISDASKPKKSMRTIKTGWLVFALVMLFNPNIQLIDIFPDFIGFFILAKFFEKASDAAPYFEEARSAFMKLGFISLSKIPALLIILAVRSGNLLDNDIVALMTLIFAVLELIYIIPAIKNIFDALTYLGERSEARALISNGTLVSTDTLRSFTFAFVIMKCLLYTLPEFLKLTRSVEIGSTTSMLTGSRYYPWAVTASLILGFVFGGVWLNRSIRYVKMVKKEGNFFASLEKLASESSYEEYEKKVDFRRRNRVFLGFIIAAVLSIDLTFSNLNDINLLPSFIFGTVFSFALFFLTKMLKKKTILSKAVIAVSALFNICAIVKSVFDIKFLTDFGYATLLNSSTTEALILYKRIEILAVAETVFHVGLIVLFFFTMRQYTRENLGHFNSESNPKIKAEYYMDIDRRTIILSVLGILLGIMSLINVFVNGSVQLMFTNANDITMPTLVVSSVPWFGLVVTIVGIAYVFYSVYYFSFIKDEMEL